MNWAPPAPELPEITSAQVDVYLPNVVYVTVVERQPVLLWQQGSEYTWVDASGVAFRPRGEAAGWSSSTQWMRRQPA